MKKCNNVGLLTCSTASSSELLFLTPSNVLHPCSDTKRSAHSALFPIAILPTSTASMESWGSVCQSPLSRARQSTPPTPSVASAGQIYCGFSALSTSRVNSYWFYIKATNLQRHCVPVYILSKSYHVFSSQALQSFLPMPLLFSLTGFNARDNSVAGGAKLVPRRAFSFVSRPKSRKNNAARHVAAHQMFINALCR